MSDAKRIRADVQGCKAALRKQNPHASSPVSLVAATLILVKTFDLPNVTDDEVKVLAQLVAESTWLPTLCKQVGSTF
jgi:hypothetical protein